MERECEFLKKAKVYYLATEEGDQPRVRPFGTAHIYNGKLYIQTGNVKPVAKQLKANPKAEICAFVDGDWIRIAGELVEDDTEEERVAAQESMLEAYPSLKGMYKPGDGNTAAYYFRNATARISSFTKPEEVIEF